MSLPCSDDVRTVMQLALQEVDALNHDYRGTEHILIALAVHRCATTAPVLQSFGLSAQACRAAVGQVSATGPEPITGWHQRTPNLAKAIENGMAEARIMGAAVFRPEHLLLGILSVRDGQAVQALEVLGVCAEQVRSAVLQSLQRGSVSDCGGIM